MFGGLGPWEIVIILGVLTLLFGSKKIPLLARNMGSGIVEFKNALGMGGTQKPLPPPSSDQESTPPNIAQEEQT